MKTENFSAVLKHINKEDNVELSSEKVELGLLNDLDSALKEYNKQADSIDKEMMNFDDAVRKAKSIGEKINESAYLNSIKNAEKLLLEFEKATKELGISPNTVDSYKSLKARINTSDDYIEALKDTKRQIKKLTI